MGILSKNTIDTWIIPHLTVGSRGFEPTVPIYEIIEAILHRLKWVANGENYPQNIYGSLNIFVEK